ncbi:MAG: sugar transferase [Lachnospiraceae bacterium]|nr:sugar transferase [Lachnospiraceae bacterium]
MSRRNKIIEVYGLWVIDLLCIWLMFLLATSLRHPNFSDMGYQSIHFQVGLLFLVFCTVYNFILDWNHDFIKRNWKREAVAIFKYMAFMLLIIISIMTFMKWADTFSRLILTYFAILNFTATFLLHMAIKRILRLYYSSDKTVTKIIAIARQSDLEMTVKQLKASLDANYQITALACLDIDQSGQFIDGIPVIAGPDNLLDLTTQAVVDEVFINAADVTQTQIKDLIQGFALMGVNCHYNLAFANKGADFNKIEEFGQFTVVTCTQVVKSPKRLMVKRLIDIIGGLAGIIITIFFFPFVALFIKFESSGPIFFSQTRIGRNGRRFKIYKFRSMYRDAEARKKELEAQNEMKGLMFKIEDDPRITKVGKFIRKTSIDELPQFFNIVKGDMSLVGTRPPTEDEFEKYNYYYRRRISMTPGLTGLWQISGRSEVEEFDDVVKYDLDYIDNWSLSLDVKILFKTFGVVFSQRGSK